MNVWVEIELNPNNYQNVEWPPESGQLKNLTNPQEMLDFERDKIKSNNIDLYEFMDLAGVPDENITFELISGPSDELIDTELPGMWETADLVGGMTDSEGAN